MGHAADAAVAAQYEQHPYPPRDPEDERHRLVSSHLGALTRITELLWGGRKDVADLRLLDAGCGTGDSAIYMASQAPGATVVAVDQSAPSLDVARRRAAVRGLRNIEFINASLLDLPRLHLGTFDYIVCSGVLHHLDDPAAGAAALTDVLASDGGMGLLLYGQVGRVPIYQVQDLMRRLCGGEAMADRVALATQALTAMNPGHLFKAANFERELLDVNTFGASGIVDLLLHARDRAYTTDELHGLLDTTGLRLLTFVRPLFYRPESYGLSDALRDRVARLGERERHAVAELLHGRLAIHQFYAARTTFLPDVPGSLADPSRIRPVFYEDALVDYFARIPLSEQPFRLESTEGFTVTLSLTAAQCALLRAVDGRRSLREVMEHAQTLLRQAGATDAAMTLDPAWRAIAEALEPAGYLGFGWAR